MNTVRLTSGEEILVDAADLDLVSGFRWSALRRPHTTYAKARVQHADGSWGSVLMHRLILGVVDGDVDHVNGNGLDNRRRNLRPATRSQNLANRAPRPGVRFKGVARANSKNGWTARGQIAGRATHIGTFATADEAARAYDAWAVEHHGEFAYLNFPTTASATQGASA